MSRQEQAAAAKMEETDMWKGYYGKEPFDLRLTALRMLYRIPLIIGLTLLGALLLGGGYYVKNVLLRGEGKYSAVSRYRIEYAVEEEKDVGTVYINQMSWNTYLQSELFLDEVQERLARQSGGIEASELGEALEALLESDLRLLTVVVTTDSPEKSVLIAGAVEAAMTEKLAGEIREIEGITVIDAGDTAQEVVPDVRTGRAFILSAVLSCFFAAVVLLLKETGDDSIWLPASLWRRYGLRTVGTPESRELAENLKYFFPQDMGRIVLCGSEEGMELKKALEMLGERCPEAVGERWSVAQGSLFEGDACRRLREADGILLAVPAGRHSGRQLERMLEYLEQQDCAVTAALLWGADERLIRRYYWGRTEKADKV